MRFEPLPHGGTRMFCTHPDHNHESVERMTLATQIVVTNDGLWTFDATCEEHATEEHLKLLASENGEES